MHDDIARRVSALQGLAFHSLKDLVSWRDDFRVDEPDIDEQHEVIFRLALEACELSQQRANEARLLVVFEGFAKVLEGHFRCEENMLAKTGYPGLDEHRAQHEAILEELAFIRGRLATQGTGWTFQGRALAVVNFMLGVTTGHILHSDIGIPQATPSSRGP